MSCTQNTCAKKWGGTTTVNLPKGKKLVNASWKDGDLWYLVRQAKPGEAPETLEYLEESNMGMYEGKVIFIEQ